jgi:hypothetical protein
LKNEVYYDVKLNELIKYIIENDIDLGYFSPDPFATVAKAAAAKAAVTEASAHSAHSPSRKKKSYKTPSAPLRLFIQDSQSDDFDQFSSDVDSLYSSSQNSDYMPFASSRKVGLFFSPPNPPLKISPIQISSSSSRTAKRRSQEPYYTYGRIPTPVQKRGRTIKPKQSLFEDYGGRKTTRKRIMRKKRNTRIRKQ